MLIKICGMTCQDDLLCANDAGVDFCGFIFASQSPRYIAPQMAAALNTGAMRRVGVFTQAESAGIIENMNRARLDFAQLHGGQSIQTALKIGPERVIRVLWPQKYCSLGELEKEAEKFAASCAWFLLDAGNAGGGSGSALEWSGLEKINLPRPWFLAGGLGPGNVAEAARICRPAGVDLNSCLENTPGRKNHARIKAAVASLRACGKILEEQ